MLLDSLIKAEAKLGWIDVVLPIRASDRLYKMLSLKAPRTFNPPCHWKKRLPRSFSTYGQMIKSGIG